uniref:Uncharacterized protein n=1 Tax=Cannabis sativa TaxID=3483 RepID=A0A803R142_CANSA
MEGPGGGFLAGDCERASSFSWKQVVLLIIYNKMARFSNYFGMNLPSKSPFCLLYYLCNFQNVFLYFPYDVMEVSSLILLHRFFNSEKTKDELKFQCLNRKHFIARIENI